MLSIIGLSVMFFALVILSVAFLCFEVWLLFSIFASLTVILFIEIVFSWSPCQLGFGHISQEIDDFSKCLKKGCQYTILNVYNDGGKGNGSILLLREHGKQKCTLAIRVLAGYPFETHIGETISSLDGGLSFVSKL